MSDLMELVEQCEKAMDRPLKDGGAKEAMDLIETLDNLGFTIAARKLSGEAAQKIKLYKIGQEKYPIITDAKILAFLDKKVAAYNKEHQRPVVNKIFVGLGGLPTNYGSDSIAGISEVYRNMLRQAQQQTAQTPPGSPWELEYPNLATTVTEASLGYGSDQIARNTSYIPGFMRQTIDYRESTGIGQYVWTESNIKDYAGIPPIGVLERLKETKAKEIFDYFSIATVNEVKDPLLLGRINGHADRYFLAQWGNDISLDEVI